jgi:hypothetical protein
MRTRTPLAAAAALLAGLGCAPRTAPPIPAGRRISEEAATALAASPDGSRLAWLAGCAAGAGMGPIGCSLLVAPVEGGSPVRVADGVAPAAGSFAWNADGSLSALARRDPVNGAGELVAWRAGAAPRIVAPRATAFTGGPGGEIAFAADGELFAVPPGGEPSRLDGGGGAFEIAIAPAPGRALAARARGAGGSPVLLLWRGASGEPVVVARDVGSFAFSPDGAWLAAVAGVVPGTEGSLVAVPVSPAPGSAAGSIPVARAVGPFHWAPGAPRLAWLEGFDARAHAGRLSSARPGEAPVVHGDRVTSFELAPGGAQLAYVRHVTEGGYAANLELSASSSAAPGTLTRDAAGFAFSPDGRFLYYRAGCTPAGDGCGLFRVPSAGSGPAQPPERLADGVVSFAVAPGRSDRALVAFARRDGAGVDLSAWVGGRLLPLDGKVLPGSAVLLPPDGTRAAWIGTAPERPGVFVADLP